MGAMTCRTMSLHWGKTRLRTWFHRVEDIIDVIPIGEKGEGIGNLPRATRFGMESTSTIQFDPIGWTGAKLDLNNTKLVTNTPVGELCSSKPR